MRDIKAPRARYKPLGIMIQPENVESINYETRTIGVYMDMDGKRFHKLRLSDFELMWPTGITDKNSKEIYEDDLFKSGRSIGVIKFIDGQYLIIWRGHTDSNNLLYVHAPHGEVVGNIHNEVRSWGS